MVDVAQLLKSLQTAYASHPDSPAVRLSIENDIALMGDESELHSIFSNLIGNAVRFTDSNGNVTVTWRGDRDGAQCVVADTGIGIPEEAIPRVTERFFRVDQSRCRAGGGTGLGLAIVKHALQRHGGRLTVESELGVGSTFTCEFPAERLVHRSG